MSYKVSVTCSAFSLVKHKGGFDFITLSKGPSVLTRIFRFLSSFLIKFANLLSGSKESVSFTNSTPINKPVPLTSPMHSNSF